MGENTFNRKCQLKKGVTQFRYVKSPRRAYKIIEVLPSNVTCYSRFLLHYLVYDIFAVRSISKFSRAIRFSARDSFFSLRSTSKLSCVNGGSLRASGLRSMTIARTESSIKHLDEIHNAYKPDTYLGVPT